MGRDELSSRCPVVIKLVTLVRDGREILPAEEDRGWCLCGKGNHRQKLGVGTHLVYLWGSHRPLIHLIPDR